ncbi:MAG: xanthine dehydrogenase family protein subunit M [Acidobacteriota bacterium]|nr:xanthine dehydrogenase family protein subunit M [Acidobacteriota bacterium]
MYPHPFRYFRAGSISEAISLLGELGGEARFIAGGQSLIPLMKLRLARPTALVDLNFIPGLARIEMNDGGVWFGAMARHADIAESRAAARIPILRDCAGGIADVQVRNRGTIGGSVAEADPSSDWMAVLLALGADVRAVGEGGDRVVPIEQFVVDAFTTDLRPGEMVREISVKLPPKKSGGAYIAVKRSAPVYATAGVAVHLSLGDRDTCAEARIVAASVGLTAVRLGEAEKALRGRRIDDRTVEGAAEAAMAGVDPPSDQRGSAEYKRLLVGALVRQAIGASLARARGESVEVKHDYAGR